MPERTQILHTAYGILHRNRGPTLTITTDAGAFELNVPPASPLVEHVASEGAHEPPLTRLLVDRLDSESVFWDVGAARGYHTVLACELCVDSHVHALEPNPYFRPFLSRNLSINGADPTVVTKFLSDTDGEGLVTGHTYASKTTVPDIVKIDVEGWEVAVLRGIETLLAGPSPTVIVEVHPELRPDCHPTVFQLLQSYKYTIRQIQQFRRQDGSLSAPVEHPDSIDHDGYYMLYASP